MKTTLNKLINNQIFKYLVAGVATTLVFFVFKMLSFSALQNGVVSEVIAQTVSIIFAFVTNKFWVFEKTTNSLLQEFIKFVTSRIFVMLLSVVANWYFIDTHPSILINAFHLTLDQSVFLLTLFLQVLTIVLNYIFSKFLIFTKK
ncbi:GtrA family protein [Lactococcus raffinolactis]|jgi:putative flippase GtrA|uniref:GtrA family protein n=1 Tax=Pseudolactococcus raffinolactis TaxID=1366 RepID=A0AAE6YMB8_9LACT|nr:GtrA family protein [Lactococcus raffinolactis]MBR2542421.1 GtrA family protein [Lactococcus sp.]MDG4962115.1 GtrA family protein [Lactococcus raffinolactis]MDN5468013.1 GtrA family protein [Lactococcus raffinolactis]MDT2766842.1 GtrA family protein [Lactococcus raffinolactis]MDT2790007.1 GtrA family protein [Lactococcus raffinolactis]